VGGELEIAAGEEERLFFALGEAVVEEGSAASVADVEMVGAEGLGGFEVA